MMPLATAVGLARIHLLAVRIPVVVFILITAAAAVIQHQ
jgi:hypothetical protein